MNNVTVRQFEHLQHSLDTRRPLITVSNHDATLDDPLLFGILSTHHLEPERMRWSLGAKEICFTNPLFNWFFSAGQVLPTVRGSGIHQSAIDEAIGLLNKNKWIHIFSEAKVNNNPQELLPFRWGIARLVLESKEPPIVVPFYHRGMEDIVLKTGFYKGPRIGKKLDILFGPPIDFGHPDLSKMRSYAHGLDETQARISITDYIRSQVQKLKSMV